MDHVEVGAFVSPKAVPAIAGLGSCPFAPGASGNVATEDVVLMLERMGYDPGIDLDGLMRASELAKILCRSEFIRE